MARATRKNRCVATCENCGAIIVVNVWPDGTLVPVGTEKGGKCGEADLRVMGEPDQP